MGDYGPRVVNELLIIGGTRDCEVGQSGDTDGRRLSDGRSRNRVYL